MTPIGTQREAESVEMQERRYFYVNYRQSFGRSGSAYAIGRDSAGHWLVDAKIDGKSFRIGFVEDYEAALRVQDYCVKHDNLAKMAIADLYEHANYSPMEEFLEAAKQFGDLPRRRMKATIEVDVEMSGSDSEIKNYLLMHTRGAISIKTAVVTLSGPRLEAPRPQQG